MDVRSYTILIICCSCMACGSMPAAPPLPPIPPMPPMPPGKAIPSAMEGKPSDQSTTAQRMRVKRCDQGISITSKILALRPGTFPNTHPRATSLKAAVSARLSHVKHFDGRNAGRSKESTMDTCMTSPNLCLHDNKWQSNLLSSHSFFGVKAAASALKPGYPSSSPRYSCPGLGVILFSHSFIKWLAVLFSCDAAGLSLLRAGQGIGSFLPPLLGLCCRWF